MLRRLVQPGKRLSHVHLLANKSALPLLSNLLLKRYYSETNNTTTEIIDKFSNKEQLQFNILQYFHTDKPKPIFGKFTKIQLHTWAILLACAGVWVNNCFVLYPCVFGPVMLASLPFHLLGAVVVLRNYRNNNDLLKRLNLKGRKVCPDDQLTFHEHQALSIVNGLAQTAKMETPEVYLIEDKLPNAFTLHTYGNKPIICLTTSLLECLDINQLSSVVAFEIAKIHTGAASSLTDLVGMLHILQPGILLPLNANKILFDWILGMLFFNGAMTETILTSSINSDVMLKLDQYAGALTDPTCLKRALRKISDVHNVYSSESVTINNHVIQIMSFYNHNNKYGSTCWKKRIEKLDEYYNEEQPFKNDRSHCFMFPTFTFIVLAYVSSKFVAVISSQIMQSYLF